MIISPGEIFIDLGELLHLPKSLPIRYYGICTGLGFLMSLMILCVLLSRKKYTDIIPQGSLDKADIFDWAFWAFIGGLIGARLWFVILQWDYFSIHLDQIHEIWRGGQSIQGGILGGVIAGYIYYRLNKKNLPDWLYTLDIMAIALPVGQAIGRIGNFFNIEAFGTPAYHMFCLSVPRNLRPVEYINDTCFHPVFAYESIGLLLVALILFIVWQYTKLSRGVLFCSYLIIYSLTRYISEAIRLDSLMIGSMPAAQVISIITIIVSVFIIFLLSIKRLSKDLNNEYNDNF